VPVWPLEEQNFLKRIGPPAKYEDAKKEITELRRILCDALIELTRGTSSVTYELGLIALACRDAAMAAFPLLHHSFDFSRYAPLHLRSSKFPLSKRQFDYLLTCRRATTRGGEFRRNTHIEQQIIAQAPHREPV